MRKEIEHKNSNERDKLMTTVTMTMERDSLRKQFAQSVGQSVILPSQYYQQRKQMCNSIIKLSNSPERSLKRQPMNCIENLRSKSEIQAKLKQILTTNDWVSFKSSPYSNGSWSLLKDMARQNIFTFPLFVETTRQPWKPV